MKTIPSKFAAHALSRASSITSVTSAGEAIADWCEANVILDGKRFSFKDHEYQRALYDDTSNYIVIRKGTQIGGSVFAIQKSFGACFSGLNVIYFFPTRSDVLEFSKSRIAPFIEENPWLSGRVSDTNNAGLKQIAGKWLYMRGMKSKVGMKSVPADLIIFDELDEADPTAQSMAKERLGHSDFKRRIELSNPTLPDYGIDAVFQESDQRYWTIKCPSCGRWTAPDKEFPAKLGVQAVPIIGQLNGRFFVSCPPCGAELDLDAGEWVAEYPDREIHGYQISQLLSSKVDKKDIISEYRRTSHPQNFFNLKLGIAWADTENKVTAQDVLRCCGTHPMENGSRFPTVMGVDQGKDLHIVISRRIAGGTKREVIFIGVKKEFEDLDDIMRQYSVRTCVIDAMPELRKAREFASRWPGKVFCNWFQESQKNKYHWDRKGMIVQENRTEALDHSRAEIRSNRIVLPRDQPIVREFALHMSRNVKQLETNKTTGAKAFKYITTGSAKEDHYSLAFTYETIASTVHGGVSHSPMDVYDELKHMNENALNWKF